MLKMIPPVALTIAGSDSSGGAGIQADIKSMQANGAYAASVVTAITAQNTVAVTKAMDVPTDMIVAQINAVMDDLPVRAVKTGMLSSVAIIEVVAERLSHYGVGNLVVDPVMVSKSGYDLLQADAMATLRDRMLPLATVCTPNVQEAMRLTGMSSIRTESDARRAACIIHEMGPGAVLLKGGHLEDETYAVDVLYDGQDFRVYREERIHTKNTHGTGCTYASAIAANLAQGMPLNAAVARAKLYVTKAIRAGLSIGSGHGPTDHFHFLREVSVSNP
ncbi:MAG: bifunctional hydroxymethylpyrimidine kinase/phosphomethylpyrimidine kinase [Bacteroidetes bacterium CG12_big_fil_rev_8_21_14_0_65_60_17]|nr:MAG: bifunctional hydroxymethylpyrimidine kinase/phosphomethylpyrimidine kinase [Bacteroidetes bacterium CG12_big_fil_rev_8_21_14_0_65_60_17]